MTTVITGSSGGVPGPLVEVRRNLHPNPAATSTTGYYAPLAQADLTHVGGVNRWTITTDGAVGVGVSGYLPDEGVEYRLMIRARANRELVAFPRLRASSAPGHTLTTAWEWVDVTLTAGSGSLTQTGLILTSGHVAGDWIEIDRVLVAVAPDDGLYFDGSASPDPSLVPSWVGAPNASESILSRQTWVVPPTVTPTLVDGWEAVSEARTVVHPILDRVHPDVTLRAAGPRAGEFRCMFPEQGDALAAFAFFRHKQTFTMTDPDVPAVGMTFVVADGDIRLQLDEQTHSVWWVVVPFTEVAP